jgi:hypothetical protein
MLLPGTVIVFLLTVSLVSTMTTPWAEQPGYDTLQKHGYFLPATASRSALAPTQPRIQCVPGVTRPDRENVHSPASSAEVKNVRSHTSTPQSFSWGGSLLSVGTMLTFILPINENRWLGVICQEKGLATNSTIGLRFPAMTGLFSRLHFQNSSEAHLRSH